METLLQWEPKVYSDCVALMPAQDSVHIKCLLLCLPRTGQVCINIFQHELSSRCQQLMLFVPKDNQHQEILVWKGPHQVTYPSPTAFRQDEMLTPTLTDVCLPNLFLKPPVEQVHNHPTSLPEHYSSLATKYLTILTSSRCSNRTLTGFPSAE